MNSAGLASVQSMINLLKHYNIPYCVSLNGIIQIIWSDVENKDLKINDLVEEAISQGYEVVKTQKDILVISSG